LRGLDGNSRHLVGFHKSAGGGEASGIDREDARKSVEVVRGLAGTFGGTDVVRVGELCLWIGIGACEGVEVVEDADEHADGGGEVEG